MARRPDADGSGMSARPRPIGVLRRILSHAKAVAASHWPVSGLGPDQPDDGGITGRWQAVELVTGSVLFTDVKVGGRTMTAILDTGSAATIIDTAAAAPLGLRGVPRGIHGLAVRVEVTAASGTTIIAGGATRKLPMLLVGDLGAMSAAIGRQVDLLLGADLFADRCLAIDIGRRRFSLAPSGSFRATHGWIALPLSRGERQELLVSAAVGANPPAPMIADSGSGIPLLLSASYARQIDASGTGPVSSAMMAGVDGVRTVDLFTLPRLRLGGCSIENVPTVGMPQWASVSAAGSIGMPLLGQFDLVFDLARNLLWLRPLPDDTCLALVKDRSGLGVRLTEQGLVVMHVAAGSPAARAGWTSGERIVAIDGVPVDDRYTAGQLWRWRYRPAGEAVLLDLASGEERTLRLADFY